jgi:hypothetical protein
MFYNIAHWWTQTLDFDKMRPFFYRCAISNLNQLGLLGICEICNILNMLRCS